MGKKLPPPLSDAQFEIMSVIWNKGEATINEVLEEVNAARQDSLRRTTIQVQMSRLEKKGWLTHRSAGRTFYFRPLRDREEARAAIAGRVTRRIFGGSCADLVKCLFSHEKISRREIERLRELLENAKGG